MKYVFNIKPFILCVVSMCFCFAMGGFLFYARGFYAGAGTIGFWFFIYYGLYAFYIYHKNNDSIPRKFMIITLSLIFSICFISLICALAIKAFNDFVGFSITYLVFNILIFVYAYSQLSYDFYTKTNQPMFFSPWIFPIYKYADVQRVIKIRNRPVLTFIFALLMFWTWTICVIIWVKPVAYGVTISTLGNINLIKQLK
jgi:hypothetical protein